jgi:hypothetical protein
LFLFRLKDELHHIFSLLLWQELPVNQQVPDKDWIALGTGLLDAFLCLSQLGLVQKLQITRGFQKQNFPRIQHLLVTP